MQIASISWTTWVKYKKAKFCLYVIQEIFFDIPLTQVCILGLHLNLGSIFKFVKEIEATLTLFYPTSFAHFASRSFDINNISMQI